MIKLKKDPGKILRTDKECTNLYVLTSEKTILVLFGIQDQNYFTKLEIVFDFFENPIQNFFPLGFGEHVIVVFKGGEVAVVDIKSTRSYEIRELDFLRKYSEPKTVNYDKYGKVIEDPRQGIHSLFRRDSFVTASSFQPIELNEEESAETEEIL